MTIPDAFLPKDGEDLDELLIRYWLGEVSPDERRRIEVWFEQRPDHRAQFQQLYGGIEAGRLSSLPPNVVAERTVKILQRASVASRRGRRAERESISARMRYALSGVALGLALLGLFWSRHSSHSTTPISEGSIYATGNGERARVTLSDGTTILLNVASRLDVPFDYGHGNRTVKLIGEALFTVVHDQGAPFTVTAGQSTTRVLGTSFVVRQYPTDTAAVIAVRDGKVAVGTAVLTAGYETVVGAKGPPYIQVVSAKRFDFDRGVLFIASRPLADAIPDLNRWYDVDIRLGDSTLATRRVVGSFEIGSITDLMWILQTVYNVRVVRDGRVLTLYPRG